MNVKVEQQVIEISSHEFRLHFVRGYPASFLWKKVQGTGMTRDQFRNLYWSKVCPSPNLPVSVDSLDGYQWHNYQIKIVS